MGDGTSQAFSDSRLGASQTILPSHNSHSHSPRPKPPKTCEPGKTHRLTFHKNKGKQKERREPSPKMLPGFKGRQTRIPPTALLGRKGHSLVAPELGVWCSPKKCSRRPATERDSHQCRRLGQPGAPGGGPTLGCQQRTWRSGAALGGG